jgi:transposase
VRIGLETGQLTTWLWQALTDAGLPMVCLDARQARAALNMKINKTDDNDAEGLAHLVRSGWYREVRVKSREAMLERSLLGARTQLLNMVTDLSNQIRGLMKTFGLVVPKGAGTVFECAGCSRMRRPWRPSCCHCWTPGAPCERVPPTSIGSS